MEFEGKEKDGWKTVQAASNQWLEYEEAGRNKERKSTSETDEANANGEEEVVEEEELMEIQIATRKAAEGHKLGTGIIAKQTGGRCRAEWALVDRCTQSSIQDGAVAVRLALMEAMQQNWQRIKIISADKNLIALLKSGKEDSPNTASHVG